MNESSGSWSTTFETTYDVDCEELTNNGLYLIFIGYLLPLLSPKVRDYGTELLSKFRNAGKVAGDLVSLTEFGFEKIQDIENNNEMKNFVRRICIEKKIEYNEDSIDKIAWLFSGDSNEYHESISQTWAKLNKVLEELNIKDKDKDKESLRP